jgi:phage-related tail fiber protein
VPGCIHTWPTETPPTGALECNGAAISRSTYSRLYGILGTLYGPGNGSTTFNLPDLRGEIVRGWDHARGIDPDRAIRTDRGDGTVGDHVGTKQSGAAGPISLSAAVIDISSPRVDGQVIGYNADPDGTPEPSFSIRGSSGVTHLTGTMNLSGNSGAAETRMRNVNMMHIIAY